MIDYEREIITNLPNEKKYCEMLASVVGQLSDGIWENSNRAVGYWTFAECHSGKNNIHVSERWFKSNYNGKGYINNPYHKMTDEEVRHYFARKIKEIALINLEDNHESEIAERTLKDMRYCHYVKDEEEFKRREAEYNKQMAENPFVKKGKFTIDNMDEVCYLSYDEVITVSDAYKAYKILMK